MVYFFKVVVRVVEVFVYYYFVDVIFEMERKCFIIVLDLEGFVVDCFFFKGGYY